MTKENEQELDVEAEIEEPEEVLEDGVDTTDWKALAQKHFGIAKRFQTKFKKIKEAEKEAEDKAEEVKKAEKQPQDKKDDKKEFDYAEKAYLKAMGIEKEEFPFVLDAIKSTGKSLDDILDSKYFQSELKEKREEKNTKNAIPKGTKRSGGATKNEVDYWIAKGELPPADQVELRRKVVNERLKVAESKSKFTDTPVVQ